MKPHLLRRAQRQRSSDPQELRSLRPAFVAPPVNAAEYSFIVAARPRGASALAQRHYLAVAALFVVAGWPAPSLGDSSYRVTGIQPAPRGARLQIVYNNMPQGGKAAGATVLSASLYLYKSDPSGGSFIAEENGRKEIFKTGDMRKPGAIPVGKFDNWVGQGTTNVDLDYGALGLSAGESIWTGVNFFWGSWGHSWGDHKSRGGSGGPHQLPMPGASPPQ